MEFNPNTVIVYRGPSMLDGAPIVVLVSGLDKASTNEKTGDMIQTWIIRADIDPVTAVKLGLDESICGNCIHRGVGETLAEALKNRTCYVEHGRAPLAMFGALSRGRYREVARDEIAGLVAGRVVRFGAYGDPTAAPLWVWEELFSLAEADNGYTHQWRNPAFAPFAQWCMASCDSEQDHDDARNLGWRTYRVRNATDPILPDERPCPASKELGEITTCTKCQGCGGHSAKTSVNRTIIGHGSAPIMKRLAARAAA